MTRRRSAKRKTRDASRTSAPSWTRQDLFWGGVLLLITVLVYRHAWSAGYIWDDDVYVTQNKLLTAPDGLRRIWFSLDSPSQYFPLVYTTFRFEYALWGLNPVGYHLVNIFLHAANALLVWRLLLALRVPGAWLAAGLFALHPVHVESVAWITERKNVLMGLFFLLSLLAWVRFAEKETKGAGKYYALAFLFYALALFSKTTACTLPAALLLIFWLRKIPITLRRITQIAPFVIFGIVMGLVTIWWERHHQGTQGELFAIGLPERFLVAGRAFWFYLGKLFWPVDLAFSYPRWSISARDPLDYLWLLAAAGLALAVYLARRRLGRGPETALLYFAATLSPMLGFIMLYTFRYSFVADHYQYLASIGPLALAAAGLTHVGKFLGRRSLAVTPAISGALLVPLGLLTWQQCKIYSNSDTLWAATIATNPQSWMAYNNIAINLLQKGKTEEAIAHYNKALELDPNYGEGHYNLANALLRVGQTEEAIAHYQKALEIYPKNISANYNLANTLVQAGRLDEAVRHYQRALQSDPRNTAARDRLNTVLRQLGRAEEAEAR